MSTKHYLPAILILAAFFLHPFSVQSQHSSDTITIVQKRAGANYYYQEGNPLTLKHRLLLVGGGICDLFANAKIKGVTVFNSSLKQKNNAHLDLGFLPNGVMLRLNF